MMFVQSFLFRVASAIPNASSGSTISQPAINTGKTLNKACEETKNKGVKVIRDPGPMMGSRLLLAFIEDPNGYKIELIEKGTF